MLELRPYQVDALNAIREAEERGVRRPLIAHATGLGKTVTFAHLLAEREHRCLVLVHRDELVRQALDKIGIIAPELETGVVKAERNDVNAGLIVASVQTLARESRRDQLPNDIGTIIVDEAHHATAKTYVDVLDHLGALKDNTEILTVGFTATPERGDGGSLSKVWQEIVHEMPILRGILEGYLVDVRGQTVGTDADLASLRARAGDLQDGDLARAMTEADAFHDAALAYAHYAPERKGVAFTPTVETSIELAGYLNDAGIKSEHLDGTTDTEERRAILDRLSAGTTQVVTNCAVLTEGFDEPSISCIMVARPTQSHGLFVQMIGRGTRIYPGKEDLLVLDVVGATERNDLVSVSTLVGIDLTGKETLAKGAERKELLDEEREEREFERATRTEAVDLFRSRMRWLPVGDGFCLPVSEATIVLVPRSGGMWDVATATTKSVAIPYRRLPLGYAQGVGEDLARSAGNLAKRDAWWLRQEPTAAQLGRLRREGLPASKMHKIRTRGDAADLITRLQARRVMKKLGRKKT